LVTKGKTVELKAVNLHKLYIKITYLIKLKFVTLIISLLVYYSEESGWYLHNFLQNLYRQGGIIETVILRFK
jgi:hypothetical protein